MNELSIAAAARAEPSRDCLVGDDHTWSYREVAGRVGAAIATLRGRGIGGGDRVALTPLADVDSAVWLFALFELGCPAVLLHPHLTERERAIVLREAETGYVISSSPPVEPQDLQAAGPISPDRTLAVVYTSGSRGAPRGARLSRRAFVASEAAHAANLGWHPEERWLLAMPPSHVGGLSILTRCLIARRCVVLSSGGFEAARTIRTLERHGVTVLSVVPTMLRRLLQHESPAWTSSPALRAVLVGGAPWSDDLRQRAVERGIPALATYGCTEACSQIATQSMAQSGLPGAGQPLPGIDVRIDDGEIQVQGDVLMDGYLGGDRAADPWTPDGWLRTGDLGAFLADGQLLVRGRIDDLIITGGENVAPQEVEAWLETVPGIESACVFSVPDDDWGRAVVAAIVIDASMFRLDALRARLVEGLAPYKRPKQIAIVDELPLNRSGKVDRAEVATQHGNNLAPI